MKHIKSDFPLKACVRPPEWTKGVGSKGKNSTYSEHGHVAYPIKGNEACSSMVANIMPEDPYPLSPTSGGGGGSESHVAYKIKREWSTMQAHHTLNLWVGLKGKKVI